MQSVRRLASERIIRTPFILLLTAAVIAAMAITTACGDDEEDTGTEPTSTVARLSGSIDGDGSSTVFPITEAVAEEFGKLHDVKVTIGISGTGGGFEKFCGGETDFSDASRPIKDEEAQKCADAGIEYVEFEVAYDGLSVLVNPANNFATCLTVAELASIWKPDSTVKKWSDVRADFPDDSLTVQHLYGPGTDSGTFDYFTAEIVGEEGASIPGYNASEDDNVLVQGIAGDETALGYFGYAYYAENTDKLKLVAIDDGAGCVEPSPETILDGTYAPLSRPLYVYVAKSALERPEVAAFMEFYLTEGIALVSEVGYVETTDEAYAEGLALLP